MVITTPEEANLAYEIAVKQVETMFLTQLRHATELGEIAVLLDKKCPFNHPTLTSAWREGAGKK